MSTTNNMDEKLLARIAAALFEQHIADTSIFRTFDYCVALDLGGGNCSAAMANVQDGKDNTPRLLKMTVRGETSLWSNIGYDCCPGEIGKISIGKLAQNRVYQYSNYKIVPTNQALEIEIAPDNYVLTGDPDIDSKVKRTVRDLTCDYIRTMFANILKHPDNAALRATPLHKILIVVGHPSGDDWKSKEAHANLVQIVKEATGVSAVLTTAESNSAILYALKKRTQLGQSDKILIIDLGAYSADITFIDRTLLRRKYASIPLGGRSIDKNIAHIILCNSGVNPEHISSEYNLFYESRRIKESHWPAGENDQDTYIRVTNPDNDIPVVVTHEDFNKTVEEMPIEVFDDDLGESFSCSYSEHLARFITNAQKELGIDKVDWVIVTGGAARMAPAMKTIHNTVSDLWHVAESHIWPSVIQDQLIDESVPFGSLLFYLKAQEVLNETPNIYQQLMDESRKLISPMSDAISKDLMEYLMSCVIEPVLREFRDAGEKRSCNQLITAIETEIQNPAHEKVIQTRSSAVSKNVALQKKADFQNLIGDFLKKLYGRNANDAAWSWGASVDPNVDASDILVKAVQEAVSDSILANITAFVLVVVLVLAPWLFLALGVVLVTVEAAVEWYVDKYYTDAQKEQRRRKQEEKECHEREKPRNRSERKKIYNKMVTSDEVKQELENKIADKIKEQLNTECDKNGFGIPKAYIEQLTDDICKAVYTGL